MTQTTIKKPEWCNDIPDIAREICQSIAKHGGQAWLVGGSVRDLCLQQPPKDIDLEIYGLQADKLLQVAQSLGHTEHVGKHFGVIKLWFKGHEIDLALPRTEKKTELGHRGFAIQSNPTLDPKTASSRRDFSINAMMFNPINCELLDFHHGQDDLQNGILRHISTAFSEDPLRILRAMQFAARFKLTLAPETANLCAQLVNELASLPDSRLWCEWQKWAHAPYPSFGLHVLNDSGCLAKLYPELQRLITCPQDPRWHPEGDAWVHTLQVCDQAAQINQREDLPDETREYLMFSALCHDLGKPETTFTDEQGNIRSPKHSEAGFEPTASFLSSIAAPKRIAHYVHPLVHDHITHLCGDPTSRAVQRLAHRLEPASIELWEMLVEADASGRQPAPACRPALNWLEKARELSNQTQKTRAIVNGHMLMAMGMIAGKEMGECIRAAYEAQLDGLFHDETSAEKWLQKQLNIRLNT